MFVVLIILLLGPVISYLIAWPVRVILVKRISKKNATSGANYLSVSSWPYLFYGSLIPIWLTLWIPSWILHFLLPDTVAAVIILVIWFAVLLFESVFFLSYAPAWITKNMSWGEGKLKLISFVLCIPYVALIIYVVSNFTDSLMWLRSWM